MSPPSGGSRAPVRYFTDHKNLIYLRTAKLLNTCQTDGLCFSTVSTSPSLSTQVIKTLKLMLFPGNLLQTQTRPYMLQCCPRLVKWRFCRGELKRLLGPGLTLHWILSPDFQTPQVKRWCFLTSTDFLKLPTSLP